MKTPDTEWETVDRYSVDTGLLKRFFKLYEEGRKTGDPQNFIDYFKAEHYLLTEVGKALTSRDTYWKERVRKEVEDALRRLDIDDHNYLTARREIAKVSGIPMMAITFNEHLKVIKEKLEATPITNNR